MIKGKVLIEQLDSCCEGPGCIRGLTFGGGGCDQLLYWVMGFHLE